MCTWIGTLNTIIAILPKLINTFNTIPLKIPAAFSPLVINKTILRFTSNCKGHGVGTIFKRKNKVEFTLPHFKVDCKATIIQTVVLVYWLKVKAERLSEATLCTALESTKRS